MAKQRNSLGVLVLPIPQEDDISFEEYKNQFGIDLDKIFECYKDDDNIHQVYIRQEVTKLILVSRPYIRGSQPGIPTVATPKYQRYLNDDEDSYQIDLIISDDNGDEGYVLTVIAKNKRVQGGSL